MTLQRVEDDGGGRALWADCRPPGNYAAPQKWPAPAGKPSRPGLSCAFGKRFPVSRILSCAVIPLGAALPRTLISDLPGGFGNCSRHPSDEDLSPGTPPEPPERVGPMRSAA